MPDAIAVVSAAVAVSRRRRGIVSADIRTSSGNEWKGFIIENIGDGVIVGQRNDTLTGTVILFINNIESLELL